MHLSPKTNVEPNKVKVFFLSQSGACRWVPMIFDILDNDGNPLWHEHPSTDAAIEVTLPEGADAHYPGELPSTDLVIEVGADIFVVGYPFKIEDIGLPVWKRVSLASELGLSNHTGHGRFYVDTATRQGMSGSLVIQKETGGFRTNSGSMVNNGMTAYKLLGIYSGRLGTNKDGDAQLGIVWPTRFVPEILSSV